ncbi:hypothetical protein F5148DRAFT_1349640 [Russula earlei]|uniref:Uncharacterized protein n=1 Tax=Russula earlei TaxID=71964 RepID=A0ACC0UD38_9AGAM|nr:hypothetical protein F5148DRAFT_1349640 [Russula earlei]
MTDRSTTGMPLLSGPAPPPYVSSRADISCRKCNKEFNIVFTRARRCNHCGYSYCSSCSDYQALMPREGPSAGFDPVPVCAFCIENLTITAGGRGYLRTLSLARLKKYVDAYNISPDGVLEKDDLIAKIISVRENGCLPYANESFYRKHSVPNGRTGRPRGLFSRREETHPVPVQPTPPRQPPNSTSSIFPRPDLDPSRQQRSSPGPRRTTPQTPPPSQPSSRTQPYPSPRPTQPPMTPPRPNHSSDGHPPQPRPNTTHNPGRGTTPVNGNSTNSTTHSPSAAPPPPQIPSLDQLLAMTDDEISHMSISALKTVLFQNHVNARLLLEKSDLVARVHALLGDERQERAREAAIHAREDEEIIARQHAMMEEQHLREEQARQDREQVHIDSGELASGDDGQSRVSPPPTTTSVDLERNGLCVVCQDEEANIAIVDCGHLAMCRNCSDLIMSTSRECPLCRTRIVTEARLLRIFKS